MPKYTVEVAEVWKRTQSMPRLKQKPPRSKEICLDIYSTVMYTVGRKRES